MKKEIKVADLDYPINLGETKTPNLEEWFCKCDVIQNMFESGKASVVEIKQDSGFGSLLWWTLANFYMFYNMKRIRFFSLLHRIT